MRCTEIVRGSICDAQMVDGFAFIPTWGAPSQDFSGNHTPAIGTINIDGAKMTTVFKCPSCGHSVEK